MTVVIGLVAAGVVGCGSHIASAVSPAAREVEARSVRAGTVLTRNTDTIPAPQAALAVTGSGGGVTIDALRADGTNWDGEVLLRITVSDSAGTLQASYASRCYRYVFKNHRRDGVPHRVDPCPAVEPLVITPIPPTTLPPGSIDILSSAVQAVPPGQRGDTSAVLVAVRQAFEGTLAEVATAVAPDGVVGVSVQAGKDCLAARLLAGGEPDVWSPPARSVLPGEGGCNATLFARGEARLPPH